MDAETPAIQWLMKGDPAIRWQTLKDILHKKKSIYIQEQFKIVNEGWGKRLLKLQDIHGKWGGGLYNPKWISTTYTMMLLRQLGLPPDNNQAHIACQLLLNSGFYKDGGINFFPSMKQSETCVTGMILSVLAYFGFGDNRIHQIADYLLDQQMEDGGWNCQRYKGAKHSSFHTTISVLEGIKYYCILFTQKKGVFINPLERAHEFLLAHKLFKSDKTGKIIDIKMTRLSFPPQWRYDILRSLDYFQSIKAACDNRMVDAIGLIWHKMSPDGTWPLQQQYPGRYYFNMEKTGQASRWNTLRALRVLNWWNAK